MFEMMEDFVDDYLDGKVNKENYPNAFKVLDTLNDTTDRLTDIISSGNSLEALSAISRITTYALESQKGHVNEDYDMVNKAIEDFTGTKVDIVLAREEMKSYFKDKIDKL